jgi:cytochrome d ubiquinol oxidase subunit I
MKLAAMEGLYKGHNGSGLVAFGILNPSKKNGDSNDAFLVRVEFPKLLSFLGYRNPDAFVPGVDDIIKGGFRPEYSSVPATEQSKTFSADEKIARGRVAITAFQTYKRLLSAGDTLKAREAEKTLMDNFAYFGYGYLNSPSDVIPNVPVTFYAFHIMVYIGLYFVVLFIIILILSYNDKLEKKRWLLRTALWSIPLAYIGGQAGWIVAELGRQPWAIQDMLPTLAAASKIDSFSVQLTFWLFALIFTILLIAEIKIMVKQVSIGPKNGGTHNV